jgi:hypothetical protein
MNKARFSDAVANWAVGLREGVCSARNQDFRQMTDRDRKALPMDQAAELHQASAVVRDEGVGAAFLETDDLVFGHCGGNLWEFDGEHSAESAAFLGIAEINKLQAVDLAE